MPGTSDFVDPTDPAPLGLDRVFPGTVVICVSDTNFASLTCSEGNFLACFTNQTRAKGFVRHYLKSNASVDAAEISELAYRPISFDAARDRAKSIPSLGGLALADDPDDPLIHWVK